MVIPHTDLIKLQALSFDDLHYLHTRTCEATAALLTKSGKPPVTRQPPTQEDLDKLALLKKIKSLEEDLRRKQKQTQQKVAELQISVRIEKERLEELKQALDAERRRNIELQNRLGCHSMQVERDVERRQPPPCPSPCEDKLQQFMLVFVLFY